MSKSLKASLFALVLIISLVGPIKAECPIGDLNGDCDVDWLDMGIFAEQWLDPPGCSAHPNDCADLDGVNGVNMSDFALVAADWLVKTGSLQVTILPQEAVAAGAQWRIAGSVGVPKIAYNDCVYDGNDQYAAENVTTYGIGTGYTGPTSGPLLDQATGDDTGITVTLTQSGDVIWQPEPDNGGSDCATGTDAYNTFGGIADMTGVIYYGSPGWWIDLTFTGLDPNIEYTFATSANRGDPTYIDRWTIYTLNGADTYTNASTSGVDVLAENKIRLMTGYNNNEGYVARWTGIRAADGSFTVRAEADPNSADGYKAYSFDVFMLKAGSSGVWRDSNDIETGLSIGTHIIEYKEISDWNTPPSEPVQIYDGLTTTEGIYTQNTGYLQVTISPQAAIDAGAKWQVDSDGVWRDSGDTVTLPVGTCDIQYKPATGWNPPPPDLDVQVNDGLTTPITATYTQQTGYLQVTISPQAAIDAGAKWQVDSDGIWRDSGDTVTLSVGTHNVQYKPVTGWNPPPPDLDVQINDGQTTSITRAYTQQTGYLQVTISTQAAIDAGAKWQVDSDGIWRDSGDTVTLPVGTCDIQYSPATGWNPPPPDLDVQVNDGLTTPITATYTQQTGYLQVTISPQAAIDAGAKWQVDSDGIWRDSGDTVTLPVDTYDIQYSPATGWNPPPPDLDVQVNDGLTTPITATYTQLTGYLQVTISTQAAIDAGAQWQVDSDGIWRDSGDTVTLSVGTCDIQYSPATGWNPPPPDLDVQINDGQTTSITRAYTQQTGYLQVTISTQAAIDAGAKWQVDSDGVWRDSGDTVTLSVGTHNVQYKPVTGWNPPPPDLDVQINDGQTTSITRAYTQQTGYLQVTISPQAAIDAGAKWQVDNDGIWRDSGDIVTLPVDTYDIQYGAATGWNPPPPDLDVQVNDGLTTPITATYTQLTGYLQVTISTQAAIDAGAKWQVDSDGVWRDSGDTVTLSVGTHNVQYKPVTGWNPPPPDLDVQINDGQTTSITRAYTQQTGYLQVTISTQAAIDAGAKWQVDSDGVWRDSGDTVTLSVGTHNVQYKPVTGWNPPPPDLDVQINDGQTTSITRAYTQQTGYLQVTISTQAAIDAGAKWQVDSDGIWRDSGDTVTLPVGTCDIQYSPATGWNPPPPDLDVQVNDGLTTPITATYTQQTGYLQVTISPQAAIDAGAKWQVDSDGIWRDSGDTVTLPVDTYDIQYSPATGWNPPPPDLDVQVNDGLTTPITATYTQLTGYLQVTISTQAAIDAGAKWQVDSDGIWRDSGDTVTLSVGTCDIQYSPATGWNPPPPDLDVQINDGQTTSITRAYTQQTGYLQVTISTQAAIDAGAKWQVDNDGVWRDSGDTVTLSVGTCDIQYSPATGWNPPPPDLDVQINDGQTTSITRAYTQQTGYLQVTISPQAAIDAGAQWQVDSDGVWRDSGDTVTLPVDTYDIQYSPATGWNPPPPDLDVQINNGLTTPITATYTQQTGYLQVTISPQAAIDAGAQWQVDSDGVWRDSGDTITLPVDTYDIQYSPAAGWNPPPPDLDVQVNDGLTTPITATYAQQTGYLQVTISTQAAIDAGAKWQVDSDGIWRDSGDTVTLPVGTYTVEFSEIEGEVWTRPPDQIVQINEDQTTTPIGIYFEQAGASLIISEFMASNASAEPLEEGELLDGNGNPSDWIEIYNPTDTAVSLDNWYLTDSNDNRAKWQFPDGLQIEPGEFLIVFTSDKIQEENPFNYPYIDPADYYHTNFNLNREPGEYLALVVPDGNTAVHEYAPEYPIQLTNISYGLAQHAATLVPTGATASYHVPTISDAGTDWTDPNFDNSGWDPGETPLGFGAAATETGQDIGMPSAAGSYSVDNGVYTVEGDGEDIWGATDDFYYVYTPLSGDGEIITRVVSIEYTNDWAKAGVMIREQLTDTSSHAMMIATPPAGTTDTYSFQWVNGATRDQNIQAGDVTLPSWVKIQRVGDTFTGFYAPDIGGSPGDWVQLYTTNISMAEDVYIGLCVTSHSDGVLCTAVFDNVTRTGQISTNLQEQMLNVNASLWTRIEFYLEEGQRDLFDTMMLRMKYEDGFVAYLNGQYLTERNAPSPLQWNSTATSNRPIEDSLVFEEINLMTFVDTLQTGRNVLAIHGLNDNLTDDEFLILPELFAASNISVPQYFTRPTPGAFNISGAEGIASDVWFSESRDFYDAPFQLMLSTAMDDAEIRYTTDGSVPTITHGLTYTGPLDVDETTTLRAAAVKPGWLDSPVETHTYIFLDDVLTQSPNGEAPDPNWPAPGYFHYQLIDYGMDPNIVNHSTWEPQLKDALKAIPTMSIVTELKNLFDPATGIYVNAGGHGYVWERPTSLELIYPPNPQGTGFPDLAWIHDANGAVIWGLPLDMRDGFHINAGLRIRGGYSRSGDNPKHAFRLFFRSEYGAGKLNYPLFGDEGVDAFDKVDLRTAQNYSWSYGGDSSNTMCREVWARDSQGLMGQGYTRSRYYHLYINGHYWGVFQTQERAEAAYASSYFGGDRDDWDCVKATGPIAGYTIEATDGTLDAWQELWDISMLGFTSHENYYRAQGLKTDGTRDPCYPVLLDIDNLIDYMMMVFYDGDRDAPISNFLGNTRTNNWFGVRDRTGEEGFRYAVHDAEHIMSRGLTDRTGPYPCGDLFQYSNPQWIHQELMAYPDYRLRFADRAYKYLFNNGLLTSDWAIERFQGRAEQINMAIIAESGRWGDAKTEPPRTKNDWLNAINYEVTNFFPSRSSVLVGLLQNTRLRSGVLAPLYPSVEAPSLSPAGGWDPSGFGVTMSSSSGTIYYTTDGNDPRLPVAQSAPGATITLLAEDATKHYLVPTGPIVANTGTILREYWTGISGTAVSDLTSSPDFPHNPTSSNLETSFETPTDWADDYGTRVRGYLHPPTTGNYTFWIASDDNSELWLSTNADPVNAALIAYVPGWTNSRVWTNYTEQQSAAISLTAGQKYYIEALQKEGGGGDNLAVTWSLNYGQPIEGQYLSPAGDIWATTYFDHSGWPSGTGGVGYERNPGDPVNFIDLFNINVQGDMYGNNGTCYIRIPFNVSNTDLADMTLKIRYDDGFIAYINGSEVASRNFVGTPAWDSTATYENPDLNAVNFENIDISSHIGTLKSSDNILAIHGLNISAADSDFLISVEIVATEVSPGDVWPGATQYVGGTVTLDKSTQLKARVFDGNKWSALNEAIYAVGPVADYLRITEIMYHPKYTGNINDPNKEFIELKNTGPYDLNLNLVSFTEGIHYTFPDISLPSGNHVVVVKDRAAFESAYDTSGMNIAPDQYTGSLANNGERIRLQDAIGQKILDFEYNDGWRPITDGDGYSLAIIDPTNSDVNSWGEKVSWRASDFYGGSPGEDDPGIVPNPGEIVINEVMSHSNSGPDWIELHNTTNQAIDISGWFLSDSGKDDANLMKYRIADGTTIFKNNYIVFYEDSHFNNLGGDPGCIVPFALSENGQEVYLSSHLDGYGMLTGYREVEDFGASLTNISFGRYFKSSTSNFNFVAMDSNTPNDDNEYPKVGPIVINEIMYNPSTGNQNEEYIELYNITTAPVTLYRSDKYASWEFTDGIDYTFSSSPPVTIFGNRYLLVVKNDPDDFKAAFTARYGYPLPPSVQVVGGYDGWLSNGGESLQLGMPGDVDELGKRYYIRIDRVNYSDGSHPEDCPGGVDYWPVEADGGDKSLSRIVPTDYGNDVANWQAATPSPGVANP